MRDSRTCATDTRGLGTPSPELDDSFRISIMKSYPNGCHFPPETLSDRSSWRLHWLTRPGLARDPGSPPPPTLGKAESAPGPASSLSKKLPVIRPPLGADPDWRPAARQAESGSDTSPDRALRPLSAPQFPTLPPHGGPSGGTLCPRILSLLSGQEGLLYPAAPHSPSPNSPGSCI